jgi:predicted amidohydrolase YtcJ
MGQKDSFQVDLIVRDANVITMDEAFPAASGLLVRDGRLVAVGKADLVESQASPRATTVSLAGRTVLPGMIDAHCHISVLGYLLTGADCSQPSAPDIATVQARLRDKAEERASGTWVRGGGYVEYGLRERRHPTRWDLDRAVPDRPCVLYHTSYHACVLNSAALAAVGYTDDSLDPAGGVLGRDENGRLNGVVFEAPAFEILRDDMRRTLSEIGESERLEMVDAASRHFASLGITSCADADLLPEAFSAFQQAEREGRLNVRVSGLFAPEQFDWLIGEAVAGSDWVGVQGIKIFADGGMSSRTAAIDGTYPVPPYGSGILFWERDELAEMIRRFDSSRLQVAVHAQGDRGIRTVLEAYQDVLHGQSGNPRRHRIEHGGAMYPDLIEKAARLRILVVSQPGFLSILGDGFREAFGEDRGNLLYPFRSLRQAGVTVAGSSDAPVITASPLLGMRDAILRKTRSGQVLGPGEQLTALEALEIYTRAGAFALRKEGEIGSLEPGKLGDFVVLEANPLEVQAEDIADIGVLATVIGGRVCFDRNGLLADVQDVAQGPSL